jgi:ATP sulfurylase
MFRLSEPHGGALVNRFVAEDEAPELERRAARLPQITLDARELSDLELIATGAASPLTGFLGVRDYQSVLCRLRLANGTPWPVPFTLAVTLPQLASALRMGAAALRDEQGRLRGTIAVTDAFVRSAREEAAAMYGTDDPAHPGVRYLLSRPTGLIGGSVMVLPVSETHDRAASPREIRANARRRRWMGLIGLATAEGLGCIEGTGDSEGALLGTHPVSVRHAPGRDALLHAIVLKNHGAREVFLEFERRDWLGVASRLDGVDLGMTPLLIGTRAARTSVPSVPAV